MQPFFNFNSLQEKISMKTAFRMLAVVIAAGTFLYSCAADKQIVVPDGPKEYAVARPENKYYYYMEAQLARQKGDLDKAIYYLKKATELEPDSFYLKKELSLLFSQQKDYKSALAVVEDLLAQNPENVEALIIFGKINQTQKNMQEAKEAYEKVIALDKSQESIYLLLGGIYMQENRTSDALRVFDQLIQYHPDSFRGHFFFG